MALEQWGWVLVYRGAHEAAIAAAQEAIALRPGFVPAYDLWAHALTYLGEPEAALRITDEAMRRGPHPTRHRAYHRGHAYYVWGLRTVPTDRAAALAQWQTAAAQLAIAVRELPDHRPARAFRAAVALGPGGAGGGPAPHGPLAGGRAAPGVAGPGRVSGVYPPQPAVSGPHHPGPSDPGVGGGGVRGDRMTKTAVLRDVPHPADQAVQAALAALRTHLAGAPLASARLWAFTDRIDWEAAHAREEVPDAPSPRRIALEETIRLRLNGVVGYLAALEALEGLLDSVLVAVRAQEGFTAAGQDEGGGRRWAPTAFWACLRGQDGGPTPPGDRQVRRAFLRLLTQQKWDAIRRGGAEAGQG